jgi:hypothetical protein
MPSEWGFEIFDFECFSNKLPNSMSLRLFNPDHAGKTFYFRVCTPTCNTPLIINTKVIDGGRFEIDNLHRVYTELLVEVNFVYELREWHFATRLMALDVGLLVFTWDHCRMEFIQPS